MVSPFNLPTISEEDLTNQDLVKRIMADLGSDPDAGPEKSRSMTPLEILKAAGLTIVLTEGVDGRSVLVRRLDGDTIESGTVLGKIFFNAV